MTVEIRELRSWLLALAEDFMEREGCEDASHDFAHIQRVIALAETLQAREGGDLPTIWAAVAFHDLGQERERRFGGDHALIGAEIAAELLSGTRFPQEALPAVQEAIRDHRQTGNGAPASLEGRILFDADKLDCLGALGVARLYCITGRYNQKLYSTLPEEIREPVDPLTIRQLRRRSDYSPAIEFQLLFGNMPDRMTTATGKLLAQERYDYMDQFFKRIKQEVVGAL
jgi:uncharacterized protein